jgi:hypothetical protein
MGLVLLILILCLAFGGLPNWGYHNYGYYPSGLGFILVVVLVILLLSGRL